MQYGAKHFGDSTDGWISGTVCHVMNNSERTGYKITIPHYHACKKEGPLLADEAGGKQAVGGKNDGLHIHYEKDVNQVQDKLNSVSKQKLKEETEISIDTAVGIIP